MKLIIFLTLFTQVLFSQTIEEKELKLKADKAFYENNFVTAKEYYNKVTRLNPNNKDAWFNLAASELNLGEKEIACEHFFRVYTLNHGNDRDVSKLIQENCPNFRNGTIMSIDAVDEKPKFIFEDKEYVLFENKDLNPVYIKILRKKVQKFKTKFHSAIVTISINKESIYDGKVIRVGAKNEEDVEMLKIELQNIMSNLVQYIPAKNKGVTVDIWEKIAMPIQVKTITSPTLNNQHQFPSRN